MKNKKKFNVESEGLENGEEIVLKKRKKRNGYILPLAITVGVIVVIVAIAWMFRFELVDLFFKGSQEAIDSHRNDVFAQPEDSGDEGNKEEVDFHKDVYNFLIVGHDRAASLADVSMLINFNSETCMMNIMQIPRDTRVTIADGHWYNRVNGVYTYFRDETAENPDYEGIKGYAKFLEENLSIVIDYYAVMDLDQFANIIDVLGGVDIDIKERMVYEDKNQNLYINLYPGQQTLNGHQSEQFVRYRSGFLQGDIGRGQNQKEFLAALFNTVKNKVGLFNISEVSEIVIDNLVTNMETSDLIYFAAYISTVDLKNVTMLTLPGRSADGITFTMNKEATLEAVNNYFNVRTTPLTDEEFDPNCVFDDGSNVYDGPKELALDYNYDAQSLVNGEEIPK